MPVYGMDGGHEFETGNECLPSATSTAAEEHTIVIFMYAKGITESQSGRQSVSRMVGRVVPLVGWLVGEYNISGSLLGGYIRLLCDDDDDDVCYA